jgi:peptidoglycan hydrolase CwlO-like protein
MSRTGTIVTYAVILGILGYEGWKSSKREDAPKAQLDHATETAEYALKHVGDLESDVEELESKLKEATDQIDDLET